MSGLGRRPGDGDHQLQIEVAQLTRQVAANPLNSCVFVEAALSASGPTAVPHGLGRKPRGYHVVGRDANAVIWDEVSEAPTLLLKLRASTAVNVKLLVF